MNIDFDFLTLWFIMIILKGQKLQHKVLFIHRTCMPIVTLKPWVSRKTERISFFLIGEGEGEFHISRAQIANPLNKPFTEYVKKTAN